MVTAASSSLRGSSVPGLPLMVLGGLLHRSRSWRGAVLTLHSLVGLLYRPVVASHLPRASGSPRHQSAPSERQSLSWGGSLRPYKHTHKKPGLNRLYCGGVSECTMSTPTVMNSLPISLYSHTLCSGASCHPAAIHPSSSQLSARNPLSTAFAHPRCETVDPSSCAKSQPGA